MGVFQGDIVYAEAQGHEGTACIPYDTYMAFVLTS